MSLKLGGFKPREMVIIGSGHGGRSLLLEHQIREHFKEFPGSICVKETPEGSTVIKDVTPFVEIVKKEEVDNG